VLPKKIIRLWLLVWGFLGCAIAAHATPDSVALVLSDDSAPYQEFAQRFRAVVDASGSRGPRLTVLSAAKLPHNGGGALTDVDLFVPVGVRATEATLQARVGAPIFAALLPRATYNHLKKDPAAKDRTFSAIYLDQPLSRRFALISEALPGRRKVGVLLGPDSFAELRTLQAAARDSGMTLFAEQVREPDELLPALKRVLTDSEVLLAVPDPLVFSKSTAQSILLTSYRAQNPLVGYSQSYVSAGALLGVYSTPAQIGQQAAELVLMLARSGAVTLPPPQYPKYFSVGVNTQVARSMGLAIEPESVLLERLMATGARE